MLRNSILLSLAEITVYFYFFTAGLFCIELIKYNLFRTVL